MKRLIYFVPFLFLFFSVSAQHDPVLLVINGDEITRSEFEYLYNKNNVGDQLDKGFLNKYLNLFINYKLKVAEAKSIGLDKSPAFRSELEGYRQDLVKDYFIKYLEQELGINPVMNNSDSNSERQILVKQIFKYLPQNTSMLQQKEAEQLMDSLSSLIMNNPLSDFDRLVEKYSDNKEEQWISRLEVPEEIEQTIFSLEKNQISKPFHSPGGIHIVRIIDENNNFMPSLQQNLLGNNSDKYNLDLILEKLKKEYIFTPNETAFQEIYRDGTTDKSLFTLEGKQYTMNDFYRFADSASGDMSKKLNDFIVKSIFDYADSSLEQKFPDFKYLMQEYYDGILLFEINNIEVWNKAATDEAGLKSYFDKNRKKYEWKNPRYKGMVVHANDKKITKQVKKLTRNAPMNDWDKIIINSFNSGGVENVMIEESLFAQGDNEYIDKLIFKKGKYTPIPSHPYTIAIGNKIKGPESYHEVYSQVNVDYQDFLEETWLKRLHEKSKVEINQEVLKTVNNHSSN